MKAEYQGNEGFLQRDSVEHKGYAEAQSTDRREGKERDGASDLLEAILDLQILKEELIPAMGCTEPISIAYAAAKAREVLGCTPDMVKIGVSNNIIKNVKSVVVPNTDGMKGIEAAAAAGIVGGHADKALEVISKVTAEQKASMRSFMKEVPISVESIDNGFIFDIIVALYHGADSAVVRICRYHTNIVFIQKNSDILLDNTAAEIKPACGGDNPAEDGLSDRNLLTIADIFDFATPVIRQTSARCWIPRFSTIPRFPRKACWVITVPTSVLPCSNFMETMCETAPLPRRRPGPTRA